MDKVYCPWCNSEMRLEESLPFSGVYAYVCECGAVSPNECGKEKAYAAAIRRPLQKPLTLETLRQNPDVVFVEVRSEDPESCYGILVNGQYEMADGSVMGTFTEQIESEGFVEIYGKIIRCWATKPTQEEREAAKWE